MKLCIKSTGKYYTCFKKSVFIAMMSLSLGDSDFKDSISIAIQGDFHFPYERGFHIQFKLLFCPFCESQNKLRLHFKIN